MLSEDDMLRIIPEKQVMNKYGIKSGNTLYFHDEQKDTILRSPAASHLFARWPRDR
jgi:hypothetical protein